MFPRNLPPFLSVPTTGDAIIPVLPQGMTYMGIMLTLGGTSFTKAMLDSITLTLGGKEIWNGISAANLTDINDYYGYTTDTTHVWLPFANMASRNLEGEVVGGIDTSDGFSDFQLKCHITGATAPTLSAVAYVAPPQPEEAKYKGLFRTLRKSTPAAPSVNTHDLKVALGSDRGMLLRGVHLFNSYITHLEVRKDGFSLLDKLAVAEYQYLQAQKSGRTIQSGLLSWDPMLSNDIRHAVPTLKEMGGGQKRLSDFEIKATVSAADNITAITDAYTTLDGI